MWVRYREGFSSGLSSWKYEYFPDGYMSFEDYVSEKKHEVDSEYSWSEHYRGVTVELVDVPPKEVVDEKIKEAKNYIAFYGKRLEELTKF